MVATLSTFRSNRTFWSPGRRFGSGLSSKSGGWSAPRGEAEGPTRGISGDGHRAGRPRVLFANDPRSYRQAMAAAIGTLRPDVEVILGDPDTLDREVERLRPDVVVCSRVTALVERRISVWVDLYPDGDRLATVSIGGRRTKAGGIQLEELISIVDRGVGERVNRG